MVASIAMLVAALLLVAANAFFVLSEFAIVKVRRTRLKELAVQGSGSAKAALDIVHHLDTYLSANQLGITLASLALGWLGEPAIARLITPLLADIFVTNPLVVHTISIVIAFTIITLLHVVLGELVPKSIAIQEAESAALLVAWPLKIFHKLAYPLIFIFDRVAALCLRIIGMTPGSEHEQSHTEAELRMIVNASFSDGLIDDTEGRLLDNVFTFADRTAREVMVPRTDMVCLYLDDSYEENISTVRGASFTRFPLCRTDKDNVIGMIHLRDLLENEMQTEPERDLEKFRRDILFTPETTNISSIMQEMKSRRIHLAVVIDEYGGTAGLITLEDILEEIVGEIDDEYDLMKDPDVTEIAPLEYEISGGMIQEDVEKLLGIDLGEHDDETIAGFVFSLLGRKPEVGDSVSASGYIFEVIAVDRLRIDRLRVYPAPVPAKDPLSGENI